MQSDIDGAAIGGGDTGVDGRSCGDGDRDPDASYPVDEDVGELLFEQTSSPSVLILGERVLRDCGGVGGKAALEESEEELLITVVGGKVEM